MKLFKLFILTATILFSSIILVIGVWAYIRIAQHSKQPVEKYYTGKSTKQERPIILVHGLNRTGRIWTVPDDGHGNIPPGARSMVDTLRANGYPNIYVNTFPDTRNTPLLENAKLLREWIEESKKRFRAQSVDVIAHSLGGLVSRAYLQGITRNDGKPDKPVRYGNDVKRLIMIATPHLGSSLADPFAAVFNWYAPRTLRSGGGPDLKSLNQQFFPCRVEYYSILVSASNNPPRRGWGFWRIVRFFLSYAAPLDGDGTISLKSQNMENVASIKNCSPNPHKTRLVTTEQGIRHRDAVMSPVVQKAVLNILKGI
ncbi:esterase/lipase family protein [Nitrospinota bacterium]